MADQRLNVLKLESIAIFVNGRKAEEILDGMNWVAAHPLIGYIPKTIVYRAAILATPILPATELTKIWHQAERWDVCHPIDGAQMAIAQRIWLDDLKERVNTYFKSSLSDFYRLPSHRLMAYAVLFILSGVATFIGLAIYDLSNDLITAPLKFMGINAWHTAINFTVCTFLVDVLAATLIRPWGAFDRRTVGKAWLIFLGGYLVGFLSERFVAYKLIGLYEPRLIYLWEVGPWLRAGAWPMLWFTLPLWLAVMAVVMRLITTKQAQTLELLRVRLETILDERSQLADICPELAARDLAIASASDNPLQLPLDPGTGPIRPSEIGHVTAEDHYVRIYFQNGDACKETLVRIPMKELTNRLPDHLFARIHRSHLVNLSHIEKLNRTGHNVKVVMNYGEHELPVSRYRLPHLLPELERFLHQ